MTPAYVITGFLGSGKTTLLLNSAKEYFRDKKVAVIVNEFGEVGVDGKVLQNAYSKVMELPEGCICCTLHAEFEKGLAQIRADYNPEVLFVETSGASEPFPVMMSLQNLGCSIEAVICVVDSKNFHKYRENPTALHQIGSSNVIVLNKADLVDEEELKNLEGEIRDLWERYKLKNLFTGEEIFKRVAVYRAVYGKVPPEVFSGSYTMKELIDIPSHAHELKLSQEVLLLEEPVNYEELEKFINSLPETIVRAKGIVRLEHSPNPVLVNYSFGLFEIGTEVPDFRGRSFLILIGEPGHKKVELNL
ncbi:G3E family GTPase [Hydrogenivirga caldilitoris]|uniref:G3E family GTPase n=1 Tax=Hydrogenivirga caldilitoris TaxID=246264 RepID=A0A497XQE4_9AQUI|nr:CobW family GTP-binding protein [Hydrogenivirga caldilitoris]RLJ71206.1 G3E family GTPase [Hydrogenivirga caldilitoris]